MWTVKILITTYWYDLLLLINDLDVDLHILVRPLGSLVELPMQGGQVDIMPNIVWDRRKRGQGGGRKGREEEERGGEEEERGREEEERGGGEERGRRGWMR